MRSSVVLAVQGKGAAIRLYKRGACLSGLRREAEVFEEARPDAFCSRYCMWGHVGPHCPAAAPRCSLCKEDCQAYRCFVGG